MRQTKKTTGNYKSVEHIVYELSDYLRPPERTTVSLAAAKYRRLNNPGSYIGPWRNTQTPYMVEPMDTFASRDTSLAAFVGPAQSGKTDSLVLNSILYTTVVDPMDMLLFCPTQTAARDFSIRRVDRLHRHSPIVGQKLIGSKDADNVFDKQYRSGMMLTLSWPSVTELAGRPVGRVLMTDYDRMPDDVGGDGNAFDLASMRTTTFGSFAMCMAESSPSRPIKDPKWIPRTPHEAPPCDGILGLYNRGDRRRWYWPCPHCEEYFEGKWELMMWDDTAGSNYEKSKTATMRCPHCACLIHPDDRHEMQLWARWVPDGCTIDNNGKIHGNPPPAAFRSWWLRGVAAAFVTWPRLVHKYLDAMDDYERTQAEEALRKFYNNDLGEPYREKAMDSVRLPETLATRAEDIPHKVVPSWVRFLVATIDVQKNRFVVQVQGVSPGTPFDMTVIDTFEITKAKRTDEDGDPLPLAPASYLADWALVKEQVMDLQYPLDDGSGRKMRIKLTACDSGGKAGVTDKAYDFYRWLRKSQLNGRFILVKGASTPRAPRTELRYPDSENKSNKSGARGDIPVLFLNTNTCKDTLDGRLDVVTPGSGMVRYGKWLPDAWFNELCAEVREPKGWTNPHKLRNEAWDLLNYCQAVCISDKLLSVERIDWDNPPSWAAEWDKNTMISAPEGAPRYEVPEIDWEALAEALA